MLLHLLCIVVEKWGWFWLLSLWLIMLSSVCEIVLALEVFRVDVDGG